jgi:hypothetical protein
MILKQDQRLGSSAEDERIGAPRLVGRISAGIVERAVTAPAAHQKEYASGSKFRSARLAVVGHCWRDADLPTYRQDARKTSTQNSAILRSWVRSLTNARVSASAGAWSLYMF